jgi:hypothetical protein
VPLLFSVRADPFERADHEAGGLDPWFIDHAFVMVPAQEFVAQILATYREFPPRQKVGSFNLDRVLEQLQRAGARTGDLGALPSARLRPRFSSASGRREKRTAKRGPPREVSLVQRLARPDALPQLGGLTPRQ